MRTPDDPLGFFMRSLRRARHMTMRDVDGAVSISPSVLSRLEHGERPPTRLECIRLSQAYNLGAYETHRLFTMAGFLPESNPVGSHNEVQLIAEQVLLDVHYPGILMDALGNVHAWNLSMDVIWKPARAGRVHVLDDLFRPEVRQLLGEGWRAWVSHSIWMWVQRTLGIAHDAAYRETLEVLEAKHGEEFVQLLEEAREGAQPDPVELANLGLMLQHDSAHGQIRYVLSQLMMHTGSGLEVYVHLPLGQENLRRFEALWAGMGPNRVVRSNP